MEIIEEKNDENKLKGKTKDEQKVKEIEIAVVS